MERQEVLPAPYLTKVGSYPPLIALSLTQACLRRVAETDVNHGFPRSRRGSSGMSEMPCDESLMSTCAPAAGTHQIVTHTPSRDDLTPRCPRMRESTGERAEAASEAADGALALASGAQEADCAVTHLCPSIDKRRGRLGQFCRAKAVSHLHASNLSVEPPHRAERTNRLFDR